MTKNMLNLMFFYRWIRQMRSAIGRSRRSVDRADQSIARNIHSGDSASVIAQLQK